MTNSQEPPNPHPIDADVMKQQLLLTRLRQAMAPHGTLSRIDENGFVDIGGAPLDHATLAWSNFQIQIESHEWVEAGDGDADELAWDELEQRLFNLGLWQHKGWQVEAYGSEDDPDGEERSIWMSATYWASSEDDLAEALRWLVDEDYRIQVTDRTELAESRIRLEQLHWRDADIDRMSMARQRYLVEHQINGTDYCIDPQGHLRPKDGFNVELFRVPG